MAIAAAAGAAPIAAPPKVGSKWGLKLAPPTSSNSFAEVAPPIPPGIISMGVLGREAPAPGIPPPTELAVDGLREAVARP